MSDTFNFEQSFARLEEILERMNSGKLTLEESLKLYEEADKLIISCMTRLNGVEKRIELLIKNRNGELILDEEEEAKTEALEQV
ncbi:MAG: exodeoxyribonuclease VII small subunit [Chlamydiales bacterium]